MSLGRSHPNLPPARLPLLFDVGAAPSNPAHINAAVRRAHPQVFAPQGVERVPDISRGTLNHRRTRIALPPGPLPTSDPDPPRPERRACPARHLPSRL